jgi:hypothetical protein
MSIRASRKQIGAGHQVSCGRRAKRVTVDYDFIDDVPNWQQGERNPHQAAKLKSTRPV